MSTIDNTQFDAYIALYPDYARPARADNFYSSPENYRKRFQMDLIENEPMLQVYVLDKNEGENDVSWCDRTVKEIEDYFPNYLPARILVEGKEKQIIPITVKGHTFRLLCRQNKENILQGRDSFQGWFNNCLSKMYFNPEEHEQIVEKQELYVTHFKNVVKRLSEAPKDQQNSASLLQELYFRAINRKILTANHQQLKSLYKREGVLGGGGEGLVYKVSNLKNNENRALKVNLSNSDANILFNELLTIIDHLLEKEITPHLTRCYRSLLLSYQAYGILNNVKKDDFIDEIGLGPIPEDEMAQVPVLEMELLDGDLEKNYRKLSKLEQIAVMIQANSALENLDKFNVVVSDFKLRNIFYKNLQTGDSFKGQKFLEYDYWKYTINGVELYVPQQKFIIKLGDYNPWRTNFFDENPEKFSFSRLGVLCKEFNLTIEELKQMFPKPSDTCSVMEIS